MDTRKIDDLAAKGDLLLRNNQNQIYVMEETNLEPGTTEGAAVTETSEEDQQENQNHNGKMFILSQAQNQFQNRQNNPQATPATASGPPDELKGMMQQLLQDRPVPARVYTPKVPYPVPAKKSRKDFEEMKCKKMLEELNVKLSLMDAIQMIPSMRSLVKGLISGKPSADSDIMMVSKECSAVLQNRTVRKLEDPGKFVLSVQIGKNIAKRMGLTNFKPTRISLVFADRSVKLPVGVLEDLQVQIGNTTVPADFVVLELEDEPKDPLILGRPFLCTAGAIIDV
ncbi:PREDICTED: uncharacterized protein LOC106314489 [Brassica oleracea var. oleracea]|uniref:uncharacterized protein LOC106314489 n=1 Tax=Brassica oleracea var. oleracea TaxID=109376 RepID=UPI0006A70793|nr:PREDICTED: uncharacterized protein LOC106314489 [Brassica oleracea var. oleracea]